jgi:hypothetical protein
MEDKEKLTEEELEKQKAKKKKNNEERRKIYMLILLVFVLFIGITIGYAALTTSLKIIGDVEIKTPKWDIHFEDLCIGGKCNCENRTDCCVPGQPCGGGGFEPVCNPDDTNCTLDCTPGSIDCDPPRPVPSLPTCTGPGKCIPEIRNNQKEVYYHVVFDTPGQYMEFTVDVINDGYYDAVVSADPAPISDLYGKFDANAEKYLEYRVTYANDTPVQAGDVLKAGSKATIKVYVEYDRRLKDSELPTTDQYVRDLVFQMFYKQKNVD